ERRLQLGQLVAVAEAQVPRQAEMLARAEQDAMFGADLLDDLQRAHALAVLHEADRARQGRRPGERVAEALQPFLEDRIVGGEDATRALEDHLPRDRGDGEGGEVVGRVSVFAGSIYV